MKKTFWENRLIAWVVFAACVLFSLSFSGARAPSTRSLLMEAYPEAVLARL